MRILFRWVVLAGVVAVSLAAQVFAQQPAPGDGGQQRIDPQATEVFKKMSNYLGSVKAFTVTASLRDEAVLLTGQKIEYESWSKLTMLRPDHFHAARHGVLENLDFYYNGKTMSLYRKEPNVYAVVPAPSNMDGMMDILRTQYDIDIPGSDLLYSDAYAGMMVDVTDASYVGLEDVGGLRAHHVAFRNSEVDWQLWILEGEKPLPVKYVITTKWTTAAPSFGVALTDWNVTPRLDDATFTFVPPTGAQKIEFTRPPDLHAASH